MMNSGPEQPPFQFVVSTGGFLDEREMAQLIDDHGALLAQGGLGPGTTDAEVRRSHIAFLRNAPRYQWLYERVWDAAVECNQRFFGVDIHGIEGNIQLARYDSNDRGFYDWHTDFGRVVPLRKISISIQLSASADYDGGDLELLFDRQPYRADRDRGTLIAFPGFVAHRVTPVTRGTRWSLVAWIVGPRWR
jgi:predicted 2-oxoglutarate/Fe(II)-dependent dioxygenase YbiX